MFAIPKFGKFSSGGIHMSRLAVLICGVAATIAMTTPPASATTYKAITLSGRMDLSQAFGHPCTPVGTLNCTTLSTSIKPGPKNELQVNLHPGGTAASFVFDSAVCVKTSLSTFTKATPKTGLVDLCRLHVTGTVAGFCGLFTGSGVATLVNLSSAKQMISTSIKFTGVGHTLYFSGGVKNSNLYGLTSIIVAPSLVHQSCNDTTAVSFLLSGSAAYKACTGGTVAGACIPNSS